MFYCYILYSEKLNRYYVGSTNRTIDIRLEEHLQKFYGSTKYTAKSDDWKLFISIECTSYKMAIRIEKHIKRMKSATYIRNLSLFPDIQYKLKELYVE